MLGAVQPGVTTTEVQMWFVKTLRLLVLLFLEISRWFMALKSTDDSEMRTRGTSYDREDFMSR